MNCQYRVDGRCTLAETLAQREVGKQVQAVVTERACGFCLQAGKPTEDKPSTVCLGVATVQLEGTARKEWLRFCEWIVTGKPRGLGDKVAKFTKRTGIAKVVKAVAKAVGKDCGCSSRQKKLNQSFPSPT